MNKAKDQHLPSYTHPPAAKTTRWNKRFWVLAALAGILIFIVNARGVLEAASWKPHTGCRKSPKPRSHYTLPSGDKIPSVALGELAIRFSFTSSLFNRSIFTFLSPRCLAGQWRRSRTGSQGSVGCWLPSYRRCLGLPRAYSDISKWNKPVNASAHRMSTRLEMR
jgi:hypothetical protein